MVKQAELLKRLERNWKPARHPNAPNRSITPPGRTARGDRNIQVASGEERCVTSHQALQVASSPGPREKVGFLAAGLGTGRPQVSKNESRSEYQRYYTSPRDSTPPLGQQPPEMLPAAGKPSGFYEKLQRFKSVASPRVLQRAPCPHGARCPHIACPFEHPPGRHGGFDDGSVNTPQVSQMPSRNIGDPSLNLTLKYPQEYLDSPRQDSHSPGWDQVIDSVGARVVMSSREAVVEDYIELWEKWAESTAIALQEGGDVPPPPAPHGVPDQGDLTPELMARLAEAATFAAAVLSRGNRSNLRLQKAVGEYEAELSHTKQEKQRLEELLEVLAVNRGAGGRVPRMLGVPLWSPFAGEGDENEGWARFSPHDQAGKDATGEPEASRQTPRQSLSGSEKEDIRSMRISAGSNQSDLRRMESRAQDVPTELQRLQAALRDSEAQRLKLMEEMKRRQEFDSLIATRSGPSATPAQYGYQSGISSSQERPAAYTQEGQFGEYASPGERDRSAAWPNHQIASPRGGGDVSPRGRVGEGERADVQHDEDFYGDRTAARSGRQRASPRGADSLQGAKARSAVAARKKGAGGAPSRKVRGGRTQHHLQRRGLEFSEDEEDIFGRFDAFGKGLDLDSLSSDSDSADDLLLSSSRSTKRRFGSEGGVMTALRRFDQEILDLCNVLGSSKLRALERPGWKPQSGSKESPRSLSPYQGRESIFSKIDGNKDGEITRAEWNEAKRIGVIKEAPGPIRREHSVPSLRMDNVPMLAAAPASERSSGYPHYSHSFSPSRSGSADMSLRQQVPVYAISATDQAAAARAAEHRRREMGWVADRRQASRPDVKSASRQDVKPPASVPDRMAPTMDTEMDERFSSMRKAFLKMDTDRDGSITKQELLRKCEQWNIPTAEVERVVKEADINADGTLDFNEFAKRFNRQ